MAEYKQKTQETTKQEEVAPDELEVQDQSELTDVIDSLLDEIDDVLEENAQEFVASFIQKGGE